MTKDGSGFRFNVGEVVGFAVTVASVTSCVILWSISTFQTKAEAQVWKGDYDRRLIVLESGMNQIAVDVSYIRGRLEPKEKQ